jgi:hypothetical protein
MPAVLTTASTVGCGHDPGSVATSSSAKLTVAGAPALVAASIVGKTVSGCSTPQTGSNKLCTSVTGVTSGLAGKLTAGGAPVVLSTLVGATDGAPPGTLNAKLVQSKLTAA